MKWTCKQHGGKRVVTVSIALCWKLSNPVSYSCKWWEFTLQGLWLPIQESRECAWEAGGMQTKSLLMICDSTGGSLQTLLSPEPAGSQLLTKSSSPYLWPKDRWLLWRPDGHLKSSSYSQLQVSFRAESPDFWCVASNFLQGCLPVPHPPQSHPTPMCTRCPAAQPALPPCCPTPCHSSPLCLHQTSFHFASPLPSLFPTNPLLSQSRLSEALPSFFSEIGSGKPTYYHTQSSGKNPVAVFAPTSTIFLLFVLATLLPTLKLQTLWRQC